MHRSVLLRVTLTLVIAAPLSACSVFASPTGSHEYVRLPLVVKIETGDGIVGVARQGGELLLLAGPNLDALLPQTSSPDRAGETALALLTAGGETGQTYNSWVFGNAPPGAVRFEATLGGVGGEVVDGVFVLALPQKDLDANQLSWRFVDAGGGVVAQGTGLPPFN